MKWSAGLVLDDDRTLLTPFNNENTINQQTCSSWFSIGSTIAAIQGLVTCETNSESTITNSVTCRANAACTNPVVGGYQKIDFV